MSEEIIQSEHCQNAAYYEDPGMVDAYIKMVYGRLEGKAIGSLIRYISPLMEEKGIVTKPNPHILDLACGPGHELEYIKVFFNPERLVGADNSGEMLAKADELAPDSAELYALDILEGNGLEIGTFDLVHANALFLHFDEHDLGSVLGNTHSLLNPGGVLVARVLIGEENVVRDEYSGRIFYLYSEAKMTEMLKKQGFLVKTVEKEGVRNFGALIAVKPEEK